MIQILKSHYGKTALAVLVLLAVALWAVRGWLLGSVLPDLLRSRLTQAFGREVAFGKIDTNVFTHLKVKDLRIARGESFKDGLAVSVKEAVIRYRLLGMVFRPSRWMAAIKRIDLVEPYFAADISELVPGKKPEPAASGKKAAGGPEPKSAAGSKTVVVPRTFLRIRGGAVVLNKGDKTLLEVNRLRADLDMREYPRVDGSIRFSVLPEATVSFSGYCHFAMKDFKVGMEADRLDLGQVSSLVAVFNPRLPMRVGGFATASLEIQGGFMSLEELVGHLGGRGSLKLEGGSLYVRGRARPVLSEVFAKGNLDGRLLALESFNARFLSGLLDASGRVGNLGFGDLKLKGRLEHMPAGDLRLLVSGLPASLDGDLSIRFSASGTGRKPVFTGELAASFVGLPGLKFEEVSAEMVYSPGEFKVNSLQASLWHGTVRGEGSIVTGGNGHLGLDFRLKGSDLNLEHSFLKERYSGLADLSVAINGPADSPRGEARLSVSRVKARGIPNDDIEAVASLEGSAVKIRAQTKGRGVVATGAILLGREVRFQACRVDVRDRFPKILAMAGIQPPEGFDGRVSGTVKIEGLVSNPVVTVEAFGSAVRFGKMAIGDQIRLPRLIYRDGFLQVPKARPLELVWDPENTRVSIYGAVPVSIFSGKGDQNVDFHANCLGGRAAILKRLNLAWEAGGEFDLALDMSGTASYPIWSFSMTGSGGRVVPAAKFFGKEIERWRVSMWMKENEGALEAVEIVVDKTALSLDGKFGMAGWEVGAVDVAMNTSSQMEGHQGIPLLIEDVADIRLALKSRLIKEADDESVLVTGPDPQRGAEIELSKGVIRYAGSGKKSEKEPGRLEKWLKNSFNVHGTVVFGKNVSYAPNPIYAKALAASAKVFKDKGEALRRLIDEYFSNMSGLGREAMLEFNVRIKEGSRVAFVKDKDVMSALGKVVLDPGGKVVLNTYSAATLWARHEFTLVDELGKEHVMEFEGGEGIEAKVRVVGETVMRDMTVLTETDEKARVDELRIRLIITPPREEYVEVKKETYADRPFLRFDVKLASEPEIINGELPIAVSSAAMADTQASETGIAAAPQPMTRPVSFRPSPRALLAALGGLGQEKAAASGQGPSWTEVAADWAKSTFIWSAVDLLVVLPLKTGLDIIGLRPDVFTFKKSELLEDTQKAVPETLQATGGTQGMSGVQRALADTLQNTEMTIGKNITKNLYVNWHVILLDVGGLGLRTNSALVAERSNPYGNILELEYRTMRYKAKLRGRFFALPDDPVPEKQRELFGGVEVSQAFAGVGRREKFVW